MIALLQSNVVPKIPLGNWVENFVQFITDNFSGFFDVLQGALNFMVSAFQGILTLLPPLAMILVLAAIAWVLANWKVAILTAVGFLLILSLGLWADSMLTLALVLSSTFVALVVGIHWG